MQKTYTEWYTSLPKEMSSSLLAASKQIKAASRLLCANCHSCSVPDHKNTLKIIKTLISWWSFLHGESFDDLGLGTVYAWE